MGLDPVYEPCRAQLQTMRRELDEVIDRLAGDTDSKVIVESLLDNLADVKDALAKLDSGTYAVCETCKDRIALDRMRAMPATRHCSRCAPDD